MLCLWSCMFHWESSRTRLWGKSVDAEFSNVTSEELNTLAPGTASISISISCMVDVSKWNSHRAIWNPWYWFPVVVPVSCSWDWPQVGGLSPAGLFNAELRAKHCSDPFVNRWWKVNLVNNPGCPSSVCQSHSSNFSDSRTKLNMSSHKWCKGRWRIL